MSRYKVVIEFATDRELTDDEISSIHGAMELQITEPVDFDQEDLDVDTHITSTSFEKVDDKVLVLGGSVEGERQYTLTDPS